MKKRILIISAIVIGVSLIGYIAITTPKSKASDQPYNYNDSIEAIAAPKVPAKHTYYNPKGEYDYNNMIRDLEDMMNAELEKFVPWDNSNGPDLDPKSITVLVNKEHALPRDYVPENLVVPNIPFDIKHYDDKKLLRKEAADAIEFLFRAAAEQGYTLYGISGYRSYDRQHRIFINNIVRRGKAHTLRYSAVPGTSEHQTGLAMDVSTKEMNYRLLASFGETAEGIWLAENAHLFGFIIRYPSDKTEITGYAYEPWHIRYVGRGLASYLFTNGLTLEEYYDYTPSPDFNFELKYADLINYTPPEPDPEDDEEFEDEDDFDDFEVPDTDHNNEVIQEEPKEPQEEKPAKPKKPKKVVPEEPNVDPPVITPPPKEDPINDGGNEDIKKPSEPVDNTPDPTPTPTEPIQDPYMEQQ